MTSTRLLLAPLLVVAGCSGEPDHLLPGPCRASRSDGNLDTTATYTYDDADRLVIVDWPTVEKPPFVSFGMTTTYTRDSAGAIVTISSQSAPENADYKWESWTFTGASVSYSYRHSDFTEIHAEHEVGLRFIGDPLELDEALSPSAPDSRLHAIFTDIDQGQSREVTYTYDGPPRQGTRTQTTSDGSVTTFTYDDDGNLLEAVADFDDVNQHFVTTYRWDAGRLVEVTTNISDSHAVYTRDQFGNLLKVVADFDDVHQHFVTTYDYGCW